MRLWRSSFNDERFLKEKNSSRPRRTAGIDRHNPDGSKGSILHAIEGLWRRGVGGIARFAQKSCKKRACGNITGALFNGCDIEITQRFLFLAGNGDLVDLRANSSIAGFNW